MTHGHATVLLEEVTRLIAPREGMLVVDGTLGAGGHSEALLAAGARVLGLDRDPSALARARARLAKFGERFEGVEATFAETKRILAERGVKADGLVLDLGVSSMQLDQPERGFSFMSDGPLDMRMSDKGETAAELIARLDEKELADVIYQYGEERLSRPIARAIKRAEPQPTTTRQLAELVSRAIPRKAWPKHIHPATRTFQALRIAVNRELEQLEAVLKDLAEILTVGGRAAIISFHSLEDRLVKESFRDLEGRCVCPPGLPVCACGASGGFRALTRKAIVASEAETDQNPRARSARLRAVERIR